MNPLLTDPEKCDLLKLARRVIQHGLETGNPPGPDELSANIRLTESLEQKRGAFVTLTLDGKLRGCIGYVLPIEPLYRAVGDNAFQAAFCDPRFPALSDDEFQDLSVSISALTPLEPVDDPDEIQVGVHGLMIELHHRSGLLLPQVAMEYGWSREEFLDHTCMKAGLPPGSWKDSACILQMFSAEIFGKE